MLTKILFIDRDGTLIHEPADQQVDSLHKISFLPLVIPTLLQLKAAGYRFIMVTNQDGLGTPSFPEQDFQLSQDFMLSIFNSQGIEFDAIRICPHLSQQGCECRKPRVGLLLDFLKERLFDPQNSFVIGDRETDIQLAENLGIEGLRIGSIAFPDWHAIGEYILTKPRQATVTRKTKETSIATTVSLDNLSNVSIETSLSFFDHMLEQLAKHGGFSLALKATGDTHIDEHHLVEDTAIVIGQALRQALGDKQGIERYGFVLPMDESRAEASIDLSGRGYFVFEGKIPAERVGQLSVEMVPHFFRTFAENLQAAIHLKIQGENSHHMVEGLFKALGRALKQAIAKTSFSIPSTKGCL